MARTVVRSMLFSAIAGTIVAGIITTLWYTPLALNPTFTGWLERVSFVIWPTCTMIGAWVGPADPVRYWFIVVRSILTNALVYAAIAGIIAETAHRISSRTHVRY